MSRFDCCLNQMKLLSLVGVQNLMSLLLILIVTGGVLCLLRLSLYLMLKMFRKCNLMFPRYDLTL